MVIDQKTTEASRPNFTFDSKLQRYRYAAGRNKGRFVGEGKVRSVIKGHIKDQAAKAVAETDKLIKQTMSLSDWEIAQASRLKQLALQLAKIQNPGLGKSDSDFSDYGKIGSYLKDTYMFLRKFSEEIASEKLSESQIKARINLYYADLSFISEEFRRLSYKRADYSWERRVITAMESCSDCIGYAGQGWQPIGTLPAITTNCACKANDKCYFEYSSSLTRPTLNKLQTHGWITSKG